MTTCETCGHDFSPNQNARAARFCSHACYWSSLRGRTFKDSVRYRMRKAPGHPLAPPSGTVAISRLVLYEKIGPGPHNCHWCGAHVEWIVGADVGTTGSLLADHVDWDVENDEPGNLVASCHPCNAHRRQGGDARLISDEEPFITNKDGSRDRATWRGCEQCGASFLVRLKQVRRGEGRFCSRSCARSQPRRWSRCR